MTSRRDRIAGLCCLTLAWTGSCAVFPDEAVLPNPSVLAGAGGDPTQLTGGVGGDPDDARPMAGKATGGTGGVGGKATSGGEAGAPAGGAGGDASNHGGGAGGALEPVCAEPVDQTLSVTRDTWLEQAAQNTNHGSELLVYVVGGGSERRALFQLQLVDVPDGAVLLKATFEASLQQNADTTGEARQLSLQRSLHLFDESKANWLQFDSGSNGDWAKAGGDLIGARVDATLPANSVAGSVSFDVTSMIAAVFAPNAEVALLVREPNMPPPAPAELAFMSRQGDASLSPKLHLRYCPP